MWKGAAVIGGNVGGIRRQIEDGENGFLVATVDQTAERIVQLLTDRDLRERMGSRARETVRRRFLMSRFAGGLARFTGGLRAPDIAMSVPENLGVGTDPWPFMLISKCGRLEAS